MYENSSIGGSSLPDKTLCLTFDDGPGETAGPGPGPRTLALARYLSQLGVPATFFVVGKFAACAQSVLAQMKELGHLIGNHSYDHPNLVDYAEAGGDVVAQISRTSSLIQTCIDAPAIMVRAPYGAWNAKIAAQLNANLTVSLNHLGPIGWEIDAGDWSFWNEGKAPEDCAARYLKHIENAKRGMVLFHDCTADREVIRRANRTLETIKILIPALLERNYRFVRLDEVPAIASRLQKPLRLALRGANGLYVSGEGGSINVGSPAIGPGETFEIEDLHAGKVALRLRGERFLSAQNGGSSIPASRHVTGDWEPFDLISLGNNRVAFRKMTGHFLSCGPGESTCLKADSFVLQPSSIFTYQMIS